MQNLLPEQFANVMGAFSKTEVHTFLGSALEISGGSYVLYKTFSADSAAPFEVFDKMLIVLVGLAVVDGVARVVESLAATRETD